MATKKEIKLATLLLKERLERLTGKKVVFKESEGVDLKIKVSNVQGIETLNHNYSLEELSKKFKKNIISGNELFERLGDEIAYEFDDDDLASYFDASIFVENSVLDINNKSVVFTIPPDIDLEEYGFNDGYVRSNEDVIFLK